jgi:hypothetical protein
MVRDEIEEALAYNMNEGCYVLGSIKKCPSYYQKEA